MTTSQPWVPASFNLSAIARSSLTFVFVHPTENLPTGTSIRFTARRTKYSPAAHITADGVAGIVVSGKQATVTLTALQTDLPCGWYTWLLEAVIGGQDVPLAHGLLDIAASPSLT